MLLYLFLLFSHFIALVSMNSIKSESPEEHVAEGRNINLTCKYEGDIYNIQWYRQYQRSRPEFLLYITEAGSIHPTVSDFSAHIEKIEKRVDLEIVSAKVTDSAVYYCALQPDTGAAAKMIFGSGTRLTVEPNEEYEPTYYELENNGTKACLATGFSRHKAALTHEYGDDFNKTQAVLIEGDSLYNQVALLSSVQDNCTQSGPEPCEDTLEPDPMVNLVSLTVLGLRLIFIKTVVFNVLMTFRLWISQ